MALTKLCEKCNKAVSFSGYIEAVGLHAGGQFICAACRRKDTATKSASRTASAAR